MNLNSIRQITSYYVRDISSISVVQKTAYFIKEVANVVASGGVVAPSNQPTLLTFTSVTSSGYTVSWTASVGGADGYVVFRRTGASPTYTPIDGTTYVVDTVYGDSTCEYFGSAVTFNESGLSAYTEYFYDVFAYNGTAGTYKFLTTSPLENSQRTLFDFGNALHYDGSNDYDLTAFSTLSASATKWTWKTWFKLDANGTHTLYSHYNNSSRRRAISVSNTAITTNLRNTINSVQTYTGTIALDTWYCLFVVFDGTQSTDATRVKFYLGKVGTDANLVDLTLSFTLATPTSLSTIDGVSAIYWGSFLNTANWLNGYMDDRAMWSAALSYAQCDAMYNGGNGAENLATDCVFYQKLNESGSTTTAVEEISALNTTLTGFNFDANDGWETH